MRTFRTIAVLALITFLLINLSSCLVLHQKDHGKHKGWFKSQYDPQHRSPGHPGKSSGSPHGHHKK